jgi:Mrp family chromosome partitioning ATPase
MSSLNKSFIKAYRKSAVEVEPGQTPARPHFAPPAATAKSAAKVTAEVAAERHEIAPLSASLEAAVRSAATLPPREPREMRETRKPPEMRIVAPAPPRQPTEVVSADAVVVEEKQLAIVEPPPRTVVDSAHVGVRPPHANFADPPRAASAKGPSAAAPIAPAQSTAVTEPAVSPRPVILPISGPSPIWRPVFEVANFTWPELTDVLLDAAGAQFRTAATDLAEACRRHRKLVSITAARRGEGCTIIALALAKALADQQQRVILVDAHFEAPGLADNLGLAAQVGLEDALSGEKPLVEALVESLEDRVVVLPLREPVASDWRLSIARLKSSLDELRRHCDVVLIDAGPVGDTNDRRRLLSWAAPCRVDRALVVRDLRSTSDDEAAEIERRLHGCGIAQWNFVENFAA